MRKLFYIALMLFAISCAGGGNSDNSSEKAAATVVVGQREMLLRRLLFTQKKDVPAVPLLKNLLVKWWIVMAAIK